MFEFLKNEIDFFIRNKTKFSRGNFVEKSSRIIEFVEKEKELEEQMREDQENEDVDVTIVETTEIVKGIKSFGNKNFEYL